jgi:Uma2 family endonuclease
LGDNADIQIALPDRECRLSDDEYFDFCAANPDVKTERMPGGQIVIVPPAGYESDYRNDWVPGVWIAPPRPGVLWTPGRRPKACAATLAFD